MFMYIQRENKNNIRHNYLTVRQRRRDGQPIQPLFAVRADPMRPIALANCMFHLCSYRLVMGQSKPNRFLQAEP